MQPTFKTIFAIAIIFFLQGHICLYSQVMPAEGHELNYRIIGFSFPPVPKTEKYTVEIADGTYFTENEFKAHILSRLTSRQNRVLAEVPHWGSRYTWKITYTAGSKISTSAFYHFTTGIAPVVDTHSTRLRIIKKAVKYADAYVFCDRSRVLYDMKGNAMWYLPDMPGIVEATSEVRDLKLTPRGSITFVTNNMAYEISYDCELLWSPPNDGKVSHDSIERYHHEFTMLNNFNYMVLGNELAPWEWHKNANGDSALEIVPYETAKNNKGKVYPKISFGTVIEYDTNNNIIWSWKSSDYFKQTILKNGKQAKKLFDSHENAFFFDEKSKNLYVSFKNFSQLFKIKYPDGVVTAVYGNISASDSPGNSIFCHQHACKISKKGYIYLFNNNICHPDATPSVIMMREPHDRVGALERVWEYTYPYKGDFTEQRRKEGTAGGNVLELPGGEILVSMCNPHGNVFIVTPDKKILWDALLENWSPSEKKWTGKSAYRYSIIMNKRELEHLVWSENTERR